LLDVYLLLNVLNVNLTEFYIIGILFINITCCLFANKQPF